MKIASLVVWCVVMVAVVVLLFTDISYNTKEHNEEYFRLKKEVAQLRELKTHFYDFRGKVMRTIPMDYLSELTIGDFDFDKYEEQ